MSVDYQQYLRLDLDFEGASVRDLLASRVGLASVSMLTLLFAVAVRAVTGSAIGRPMHPVTVLGLLGGLLAGSVVAWIIGIGVDAGAEERLRLRGLQYAHVAYGTVAGGLFPWVYHGWMGAEGGMFVAFPGALHSGHVYSMLLFAVAGAVYLGVGVIGGVGDYLRQWGAILGMYVIYGMVLGVWMGLSEPLWYALLGLR